MSVGNTWGGEVESVNRAGATGMGAKEAKESRERGIGKRCAAAKVPSSGGEPEPVATSPGRGAKGACAGTIRRGGTEEVPRSIEVRGTFWPGRVEGVFGRGASVRLTDNGPPMLWGEEGSSVARKEVV